MASPPASSTSLTKRSSDTSLMPPPSKPTKRQKRPSTVLDEDVYADGLSHIVARDFFPGLLETEAQREYMEALDSHERDWIRQAGRKLTQVMTPVPDGRRRMGRGTGFTPTRTATLGQTPQGYVGETPGRTPRTPGGDAAPSDAPNVDVNMSLGAFQTRYTSEDNESFNALLDKQNEKRAARYAFFQSGNKILAPRQIAERSHQAKLVENSATASSALITQNADGQEVGRVASGGPSEDLDARPASVNSFPDRQGPRNHFMFGPQGVENLSNGTPAQQAEQKSNSALRSVTYAGTRFASVASVPDDSIPSSPSVSAIDAAIAGRPKPTESEAGFTGAETPRVNGYEFVDADPTPSELGVAITDEEADEEERKAAMQLLPKVEEGSANPFNIKERSKREGLHARLVEKADVSRRKEKGGSRLDHLRDTSVTLGRTPTPKFTSGPTVTGRDTRVNGMTPAAQRLAGIVGTPVRSQNGFGSEKKANAWTPRVRRPA